jgi:hypothetical protein
MWDAKRRVVAAPYAVLLLGLRRVLQVRHDDPTAPPVRPGREWKERVLRKITKAGECSTAAEFQRHMQRLSALLMPPGAFEGNMFSGGITDGAGGHVELNFLMDKERRITGIRGVLDQIFVPSSITDWREAIVLVRVVSRQTPKSDEQCARIPSYVLMKFLTFVFYSFWNGSDKEIRDHYCSIIEPRVMIEPSKKRLKKSIPA